MANPRSLVNVLYTYWDVVEALVRLSRDFAVLSCDQVLHCIAKVSGQQDAEFQGTVLRTLTHADILQTLPRSSDLQLNTYLLEFVRGLTREHDLGLAAVLQARVAAIRDATEALSEGLLHAEMDRVRNAARQLAELLRQIYSQLDQDRHALLELAETAKAADSSMPIYQRYRQVLDAYEHYVEPMNQMMDSGPGGIFYRYLEGAERILDQALEQLLVQGALYSHCLQLRQVAHQAKELRRFGRQVAQQCADTLLPLREELRQHNQLSSCISLLLGQVRKRGLRRTFARRTLDTALPVWRNERGFRVQLGDEVRAIMAAARHYRPQAVAFPQDEGTGNELSWLEQVDENSIRMHLLRSLPVADLLGWLYSHYPHLQDATLLRIFSDLLYAPEWTIEASNEPAQTLTLQTIRVQHHPQRVHIAP